MLWVSIFSIGGLLVTAWGAWVTASAVVLSEDDAIAIGVPRFAGTREQNLQMPVVKNLLKSSEKARQGLLIIFVGTGLQVIAVLIGLFVSS